MFRVRWLGRVPYAEAHALQRALHDRGRDDHLLLLEHPHVFTLGVHADRAHVLVDPAAVGRRARGQRPGWGRHLPRAGPARRLSRGERPHRAALGAGPRPRHRAGRDRHPGRARPGRWPAGRVSRGVGGRCRARGPARSVPSACGSPGDDPCTGWRSNVTPTWRGSTASCRAASATGQGGDVARRRRRRRVHARGRRHPRAPRRASAGLPTGSSSARTWHGP